MEFLASRPVARALERQAAGVAGFPGVELAELDCELAGGLRDRR